MNRKIEINNDSIVIDLFDYVKNKQQKNHSKIVNIYRADSEKIYFGQKSMHIACNKRFIKLDEDFAYILGVWVADGSTHSASVCFNNLKEKDVAEYYIALVKKVFGQDCIKDIATSRLGVSIKNSKVYAKMFISLCGEYSHGKFIPDIIMHANEDVKRAFLDGYVVGDGCILKHPQYGHETTRVRTVSHHLAYDIKTLLIELGYCPKMSYDSNSKGYNKNGMIWTIEWRDRQRVNNGSCRSWNIDNKMVISRIYSMQLFDHQNEYVYNLEVENDNTYATDGITVHNSAEGFGLSTLESLYASTPIIVPKTGGLTTQVINRHTNEEYGVGLDPDVGSLVGSQSTPFIVEHYTNNEKYADAIYKLFSMSRAERRAIGLRGRQYALQEFNMKNLIEAWDKTLTKTISEFKQNKSKPRYKLMEL